MVDWFGQKKTQQNRLNIPLTYVNSLFDSVKDSTGKPVEKMAAPAFLQLLQTSANQTGAEHAQMLAQLIVRDIQSDQMLLPLMQNSTQNQTTAPSIASLDGDGSTYSKADFQALAQCDSAFGQQGAEPNPNCINDKDYAYILLMKTRQQNQQLMASVQQQIGSMSQGLTGLGLSSTNGSTGQNETSTNQTALLGGNSQLISSLLPQLMPQQ